MTVDRLGPVAYTGPMSSHLEVRTQGTNEGTTGTCKECNSFWYDNIIDGLCPDCLLIFAHEGE